MDSQPALKPSPRRRIAILTAFLAVALPALYFRTFPIHPVDKARVEASLETAAKNLLLEEAQVQMRHNLDLQYPGMDAKTRSRIAEEKVRLSMEANPALFNQKVGEVTQAMKKNSPRENRRPYLLEADPYYFFYQTEKIAETGKISGQIKNGLYFNPLMNAPFGHWTTTSLHPFCGYAWYRFVRWLSPKTDMMTALCYWPLVVDVLVVFAYFLLASALRTGLTATVFGATFLMLSPVFIQRSAFGWYDTDPYVCFFLPLLFWTFFRGVETTPKKRILWAALAGLLTGLFSLFWAGWPLLPGLVLFSGVGLGVIQSLKDRRFLNPYWIYSAWYAFFILLFAMIFLTPPVFLGALNRAAGYLRLMNISKINPWPNIFSLTGIGEAKSIGFLKLVYISSHPLPFTFVCLSVLVCLAGAAGSKNKTLINRWIAAGLPVIPLFFLALNVERFALFFVFQLSLLTALSADQIFQKIKNWGGHLRALPQKIKMGKIAAALLIVSLFFPMTLLLAYVAGAGTRPIMNDNWADALQKIREKTPEDAIINSWWTSGHFITSLARRRVTVDGATQYMPQIYWLSLFLMSEDERQAAGLLRMLNTSGNKAPDWLLAHGYSPSGAVELLLPLVKTDRESALRQLPPTLTNEEKEALLDLTHGPEKPVPAYVLLNDDLINKNLLVTVIAKWNFEKAKKTESAGAARENLLSYLNPLQKAERRARRVFSITGPPLKYVSEKKLARREGNTLVFKNGLVVDAATLSNRILLPQVQGQPASLFYMEGGKLVEKPAQKAEGEELLDVSALLIKKGESWEAVLADPRLIRSVMFRMYYLDAEGLELFRPFARETHTQDGSVVCVFEVLTEKISALQKPA